MTARRPIPEFCDACASADIDFRELPGARGWRYCWICNTCKAATACHNRTNIPLGIMATARVRRLRRAVHESFDKLWTSGLFTREKAYRWLAGELGIHQDTAHISWLTEEQLRFLTLRIPAYYAENAHKAERRVQQRIKDQMRNEAYERKHAIRRIEQRRRSATRSK